MLELWMSLPSWLRMIFGVLLMLTGGVVVWMGVNAEIIAGRRTIFTCGFAMIGAGFAMVMIGGKSDSERNGYHF